MSSPTGSGCTRTPCASTSSGSGRQGSSTSSRGTGGPAGAPGPLIRPPRGRARAGRRGGAGLADVEPVPRGTGGRPQHVYSLAAGAPGLGFDPPSYTLLAGLLAALAERVGAAAADRGEGAVSRG